tara:strand:- start:851 stop:1612 length:762 start_codon:yes stop_codon:yes gene_type:complete
MYYVDREMWDAQPPRGGAFDPLRKWRTGGVVIHHSGVQDGPKGTAAVHAFERHHLSKGWDGIGYNWLVDETGAIFEGRGWDARGAATKGWNSRSVSVCYTGWGYKQPHLNVLESIKALVAAAESHFGKNLWVSTHRKKGSTTCPGDWLGDWVEGGMGDVSVPQNVDWDAIIRYFKDLRTQVEAAPLSRWSRSRGRSVRLVQERLRARGFDPGVVDGIYGKKTAAAVKEFQRSQGFLKVNGTVNGDTFGALFLQ